MTAPLTPPHQPPPHDGAAARRPSSYAPAPDEGDGPDLATEVRQGAVVLLLVSLAGVALGLLWLWLAPRIPLISDSRAVFLKDTEGEGAAGADATFALLALGFGALSAAAVFWFHRRGGIVLVVGLAVGGLLGSALGWGVGTLLGPTHDVAAHARAVGEGVTFDAPLELHAYGALLAWPVAAMIVHLGLTAFFGPRDPEPDWDLIPYAPPATGDTGPAVDGAAPDAPRPPGDTRP
ncbi:DUF2567 domain-containing protein [Streptomyces sp. SP18CS02]|uniref:DUF2567 domain-containing protein n=1 Tax=Streptomyces sp. SP18CS02 TaxID=3002531 RepID=UPI002E79111A|nr:DUF2567 domain-containing protein [Streptomyces sp. SP18CS02]MEE1755040.1 DUF2567 domain-containing protein [Streptomyces sp. SP18CS02]